MKRAVIVFSFLLLHGFARAESGAGKQLENARFEIARATVEFLATDRETFKEARQTKCEPCVSYDQLFTFVEKNRIRKADGLIRRWRAQKVDTSSAGWKKSMLEFRNRVVNDITSGAKSKRKKFTHYDDYQHRLASIIEAVDMPEPVAEDVPDIAKVQEDSDPAVKETVTEAENQMLEKPMEPNSYFGFLPDLSKDMSYSLIFLLAAGLLFLLWTLRNKKGIADRYSRDLQELRSRSGNTEWQSKNTSSELKAVTRKLKEAEAEIAMLRDNLKAETERNARLSAVPEISKPVVKKPEPKPAPAPVVKYARYADQGDGFSVQELLDEEDSETIFEITPLSPGTATFRISGNQSAQRYALSNSPYFLGKTSQYDTFPSGSSLINTDVPGELKLQGSKWLIVKPVRISFS